MDVYFSSSEVFIFFVVVRNTFVIFAIILMNKHWYSVSALKKKKEKKTIGEVQFFDLEVTKNLLEYNLIVRTESARF